MCSACGGDYENPGEAEESMNAKEFNELLRRIGACSEAVKWAKGKSFTEAWMTCERPDWMLWLCARMEGRVIREAAPGRENDGVSDGICELRSLPANDGARDCSAHGEFREAGSVRGREASETEQIQQGARAQDEKGGARAPESEAILR